MFSPDSYQYRRHDLIWLNASGWQQVLAGVVRELHHVPLRWQQRDWPLVVRRRDADAGRSEVCAGIALPPDASGHKLRIAVSVDVSGIREHSVPLEIAAVLPHAHAEWRAALIELQYKAQAQALDLRVYGSLALQALTGLTYLRPGSDIDLLLTPGNRFQLERGMRLLAHYRQLLPLDGEVQFPAGAVAWKEWLQAADDPSARVLLKRLDDVALMRVADVVAGDVSSNVEPAMAAAGGPP